MMSRDTQDNVMLIGIIVAVVTSFFSDFHRSWAIVALGFAIIVNRAFIRDMRHEIEELEKEKDVLKIKVVMIEEKIDRLSSDMPMSDSEGFI